MYVCLGCVVPVVRSFLLFRASVSRERAARALPLALSSEALSLWAGGFRSTLGGAGAAGASLEQRDLLDDVRRVREDSRGNDAGEVVGEVRVVRRVEAQVELCKLARRPTSSAV